MQSNEQANKGELMSTFLIFGLGILIGMVVMTVFNNSNRRDNSFDTTKITDNLIATEKKLGQQIAELYSPEPLLTEMQKIIAENGEILKRIEARPEGFKLPEQINLNVTERRTIYNRAGTTAKAPTAKPPSVQAAPANALPTGTANKKLPGLDKVKKQVQELSQ